MSKFQVGDRVRPNLKSSHNRDKWYENYSVGTLLDLDEFDVKHDLAWGSKGFVATWSDEDELELVQRAEDAQLAEAQLTLDAATKAKDAATLDYWRAVIAVKALESDNE